jgi:hypothetical protein
MKKFICLLYLIFVSVSFSFAQYIIIRFADPNIETCIQISGYSFPKWDKTAGNFDEFEVTDSLFYVFVKQKVDLLKCLDNVSCPFPDVRLQIIVVNGEEYDIVSSDVFSAMEKNGRSVAFDRILQKAINDAIKKHEKHLPLNKRIFLDPMGFYEKLNQIK